MSDTPYTGNEPAGWRGKLAGAALLAAIGAVVWFGVAALGTRAGLWSWQTGLETLTLQFGPPMVSAVIGLSLAAGIAALAKAPRKRPFMMAMAALLVSGLTMGRLAAHEGQMDRLPPLHDIQTDWSDPIAPSDALVTEREAAGAQNAIEDDPLISAEADARWPGLSGRRVAEVQEEAEFVPGEQKSPRATPYPKLAPLIAPGTPEEGYAAALAAVEARGWTIVLAEPEAGRIEATETSFWYGFKDDILIRIRPDEAGVRIDVRSVSRVGLSDLGVNAKRVRNLLDELEVRLNKAASAPG
ncbi:hypothetical protein HPO_01560 [Hyphomonas polymorpha PS728]|uniref:DUF1499 domain-containing protein n=1 Tax=Hyphomonas polymorpha PS728 TaxID=1280954 RepID=A0A062VDQ1_9PROT|nr:DUF1499 domain-containing protein [Hyphomonas polymorpha]KDA00675.1 hypothetical protein HPO_01560 [Hyphomonas polymorpha PS728]